ncbi:MAG: 20S proteasome subunit A/B [Dermatophilaceae bacterium]
MPTLCALRERSDRPDAPALQVCRCARIIAVTYCLAVRLSTGLVFLSDTRTNAGVDNLNMYRKLHVVRPAADRVFVLQSAGNLATTQEVLDRVAQDLHLAQQEPGRESLASVGQLWEAALYVGRLNQQVTGAHREALSAVGANASATFILGGQIAGSPPDILLVYPEGNYTRASEYRPFLQIGETKYGRFMLELVTLAGDDLGLATKIAVSSMVSAARSNLSVGPPYDLAVYVPDSFEIEDHRIPEDSPLIEQLRSVWVRHVLQAIGELPSVTESELTVPIPDMMR